MEKNKIFTRCKRSTKAKLRADILQRIPHHYIPGNNMSCNKFSEEHGPTLFNKFRDYPYSCDFPKPLLPPCKPNREFFNIIDTSSQLISVKQRHSEDIDRFTWLYEKNKGKLKLPHQQDVTWKEKKGMQYTKVPRYIAEVAQLVEEDPDPYFSGSYNWYYSRGTINAVRFQNRNVLLLPYNKELTAIPIYVKGNSLCWPDLTYSSSIALNDPLFETVANSSNSIVRILARFKTRLVLYNLSSDSKGKLSLIEVRKHSSRVPYISADLNRVSTNHYCTVSVNREVTLWDMVRQNAICSTTIAKMRPVVNKWSNIRFCPNNPSNLIYVDSSCLHYLDIRLPQAPALSMYLTDDLEICENLSSHISSCCSNFYSYVGSYHSLLLCDKRNPKNSIVNKWTHQFKSPPLFMDVHNQQSGEIVVLGSQISGETSIILNKWERNNQNPESYIMPFTPLSIMETLTTSRSRGKCYNPMLKQRLSLCNTGCSLIKDSLNGETFLFFQNSNNDVFYQNITNKSVSDIYSKENCKSLHALEMWDQCLKKRLHDEAISPCVINERINADHIRGYMKNQSLRAPIDKDDTEVHGSFRRTMLHLSSFVDILAPELLAAWEIQEDTPFVTSTAPNDKVLDWLQKTGIDNDLSISQLVSTQPEKEEVAIIKEVIIPEPPRLDVCEMIDEDVDYLLPKVNKKQDTERRKSQLRSQYVPGF